MSVEIILDKSTPRKECLTVASLKWSEVKEHAVWVEKSIPDVRKSKCKGSGVGPSLVNLMKTEGRPVWSEPVGSWKEIRC